MSADLLIHRYVLKSKGALNRASARKEHPGALVFDGRGYACVHPWPDLGDAPLDDVLRAVAAGGGDVPMARSALRCMEVDGDAREAGCSLFQDLVVPPSHFSWDAHQSIADQQWQLEVGGFSSVKMKAGVGIDEGLRDAVGALAQGAPNLGFRFDFNGQLPANAVERAFGELADLAQGEVDFFEDPCPYHPDLWEDLQRRTQFALALDWGYTGEGDARGADVLVWKPAGRPVPKEWPTSRPPMCVTSMMDHPLGQSYAAYEAGILGAGRTTACGLVTQALFEPNAFSEALGTYPTSRWQTPEGTGLGFDELLRSIEWTKFN